jgi:hypothetical protein
MESGLGLVAEFDITMKYYFRFRSNDENYCLLLNLVPVILLFILHWTEKDPA